MAKKTINTQQPQDFINVGSAPNSKDGDSLRAAFARLNDAIDNIDSNFSELYTAVGQPVDGNLKTDIVGSVFGDDSSLLVDGVMNRIVGPVYNAVGNIKITGGTVGQILRTDGSGNLSWVTTSQFSGNYNDLTNKPTIPTSFDRLSNSGDEVILIGGANPFVTFPAITGGDQLIIQGAEVSSVSGSLALTSQDNLNIIANGSGAAPGGSKNWTFSADGGLTIPGDIRSDSNINIDINLADSTLRRWQFGEDGELTLPEDAVVKTISGNLTIQGQSYVFIDSATNGQIEIGRSSGVGAVSLGNKSNGTNVVVDDLFVANGVYEFFSSLADATGVVTHNCANGHLFYHTSPDANWTVNLTNLLDTWNRATSVTIIIAQGATGYYPSAVQIAGVAQTINWQGNITPTPSTNRTDVVTFSIINNAGTYTVLGQLTGF